MGASRDSRGMSYGDSKGIMEGPSLGFISRTGFRV